MRLIIGLMGIVSTICYLKMRQMGIKSQINRLESSKSSDMKLLAGFKEKVESGVYPDPWEL